LIPDEAEVSCPIEDRLVASPKPIYDPLRGPPVLGDPGVQAMPFFEFVLWDIASANPDLRLGETNAASKRSQGKGGRKASRELASMVCTFQGRARQQTDEIDLKKIVFEPGSKLFACTHLPGHYVSMEVANLGASTDVGEGGGSLWNAVTITRADSNSLTPQFSGRIHTALHVALRALDPIGPTHWQEVEHLGLPLPPQNLPDCAFFMLIRLESG
jgi:hypothetical protein